ncbi:putative oxidoreductase [Pseudomonas aeruginosa]|nr:putative oxidoreductase [Pseudomonas aeruginosa]
MPRAALAVYPEVLTPVEASVYYTGLLVAYFGLVDLAGLKAGQTVLITEAARMYGPVSIQLAKALGARVIASTKSAEEREFLREQGADKVVVTDEQDLVLEVEALHRGQGRQCHPRRIGRPADDPARRCLRHPRQAGAVWLQRRQRVGVPGLRRVSRSTCSSTATA